MESDIREVIVKLTKDIMPEVAALRHHLHANPELSFEEHKTAAYISRFLTEKGIEHITGVGGTGIIAIIEGDGGNGPTLALRAEMDALPLTEENDVPYRSRTEGVMHACGHDAHMAMVLGAGVILHQLRERLKGRVILLFQPGEEKSPGGASIVMGSEEFRANLPDMIVGQHLLPDLLLGVIGYRGGEYMASADEIHIKVKGKGGHAAQPHKTTNQIVIAAKLIVTIKEMIEGEAAESGMETIFAIGMIEGGKTTNIIPAEVVIAGTLRTFSEKWRERALLLISDECARQSKLYGVTIELQTLHGYPVLINHVDLADRAGRLSRKLLGDERVSLLPRRMGSDDFANYGREIPALYYRLGTGAGDGPSGQLHTPHFNFDENIMETGLLNMVWLAINLTDEG